MRLQEAIVVFILTLETLHCVELPANACNTSLETLRVVANCPSNEHEYKEAARTKNCSKYNHACRSFEYHCVLNEWTTSLVEVCAPSRLVLFGKCTEFNKGLQCIRGSYLTDCKQFSKPCPSVYNSTRSFMYPGCYHTVRMTTNRIGESLRATGTTIGGITKQEQNLEYRKQSISNKEKGKTESDGSGHVWMIVLPATAVLILIVALVILFGRKQKKGSIYKGSKQKQETNKNTDASKNCADDSLLPQKDAE